MSFLGRLRGRGEKPEHHHSDRPVPGWDAITSAADALYPGITPMHWGTVKRWRAGGPDPLDGISAYPSDRDPKHWHYVTYGLSELYAKESPIAERSGWGIELTYRVIREPRETAPPVEPVIPLQALARYVFTSGNVLGPGHHLDTNGPITSLVPTKLEAFAFIEDPELGQIDTPFGHLTFLQAVGITRDEYEAMQAWDSRKFLAILGRSNPLLVTDPRRQSILDDAGIRSEVERATRADGSAMGEVAVPTLEWSVGELGLQIAIESATVPRLRRGLHGRVLRGEPFGLHRIGGGSSVWFARGDALQWHEAGPGTLHIEIDADLALDVASHASEEPGTAVFGSAKNLRLDVSPTVIQPS